MRKSWRVVLVGVAVAGCAALAGCRADDEPSAACRSAVAAVDAKADVTVYRDQLTKSLTACASADEWIAAVKERPEALGVAGTPGNIDSNLLQEVCRTVLSTSGACSG